MIKLVNEGDFNEEESEDLIAVINRMLEPYKLAIEFSNTQDGHVLLFEKVE